MLCGADFDGVPTAGGCGDGGFELRLARSENLDGSPGPKMGRFWKAALDFDLCVEGHGEGSTDGQGSGTAIGALRHLVFDGRGEVQPTCGWCLCAGGDRGEEREAGEYNA